MYVEYYVQYDSINGQNLVQPIVLVLDIINSLRYFRNSFIRGLASLPASTVPGTVRLKVNCSTRYLVLAWMDKNFSSLRAE